MLNTGLFAGGHIVHAQSEAVLLETLNSSVGASARGCCGGWGWGDVPSTKALALAAPAEGALCSSASASSASSSSSAAVPSESEVSGVWRAGGAVGVRGAKWCWL